MQDLRLASSTGSANSATPAAARGVDRLENCGHAVIKPPLCCAYVGDACARRRAADNYLSMTYGSDSMTARFFALPARPAALLFMGLMFAASPVSPASAQQSCQEDFQRLTQRRMAQIGVLNRLGK